ncbi:MAG: protein phosphatase 2C domain-containing protein [Patescibacteria group bacterium]
MEGLFGGNRETVRSEKREQLRHLEIAADTATSPLHPETNEDTLYFSQERGVFGVFDGIGGAPAGDLASRAAARQLTKQALEQPILHADSPEALKTANDVANVFLADVEHPLQKNDVEAACKTVMKRINIALDTLTDNPSLQPTFMAYAEKKYKVKINPEEYSGRIRIKDAARDLGTTVSLGKIWTTAEGDRKLTIAHIGDSAIYRLRGEHFDKLTVDDSFITPLVAMGLLPSEEEYSKRTTGQPNAPDYSELRISIDDIRKNKKASRTLLGLANYFALNNTSIAVNDIRHYVTQSMSANPYDAITPRVFTTDVQENDVFVALTDGVIDNLTHDEIRSLVERKKDDPQQLTLLLKSYAMARSKSDHVRAKQDDITAIAVRVT